MSGFDFFLKKKKKEILHFSLTEQFNPAQKTHFIKADYKHVFAVIIVINVIFHSNYFLFCSSSSSIADLHWDL